jgi:hypothetical protein
MAGVLRLVSVLAGVAGLLLVWGVLWFAVSWLIGLGFRFVPMVGRRYAQGRRRGREPIETESAKPWSQRRP